MTMIRSCHVCVIREAIDRDHILQFFLDKLRELTTRFVLVKPVKRCGFGLWTLLGDVLCKSIDFTDEVLCVIAREHLK